MEKIVVLKGHSGDENLVNCLRMLFPECMIEVHEKRPSRRMEGIFAEDKHDDTAYDERLEEYLSFL